MSTISTQEVFGKREELSNQTNPSISYASVSNQLKTLWEEILKIDGIEVEDDFIDLGGDSLKLAELHSTVCEYFNRDFPVLPLLSNRTLGSMANFIAAFETPDHFYKFIVLIRPKGKRRPLFLIHDASGNVGIYHELAKYINTDVPLYGLRFNTEHFDNIKPLSIRELAEGYVDEILKIDAMGPYQLAGLSVGGLIAFEIAQVLHKAGKEVAFLGLIDTVLNKKHGSDIPMRSIQERIVSAFKHLRQKSVSHQLSILFHRGLPFMKYLFNVQKARFLVSKPERNQKIDPEFINETMLRTAARQYVPTYLPIRIVFFLAMKEEHESSFDAWKSLCRQLLRIEVDGYHSSAIKSGYANTTAKQISDYLL